MKKTLIALFMCSMFLNFSSCDEDDLKDFLPDIKVDINETENILVFVGQTNGERTSFSEKTNFSIVNKDTEDYLKQIKEVKITKLSYKIINFSGDPIGDVDGSFAVAGQVSLQNAFVVKTAADNQIVYEITDLDELNRIANDLKSGQTVAVEYSGSALCDADDLNFTVEVSLVAKVTIDPSK